MGAKIVNTPFLQVKTVFHMKRFRGSGCPEEREADGSMMVR